MKTDDLVKALGDVRVRYYEGIFEASAHGITAHGTFADGAIWNVLRLLREQQEERANAGKANGYAHSELAGDIPTAGQDSMF